MRVVSILLAIFFLSSCAQLKSTNVKRIAFDKDLNSYDYPFDVAYFEIGGTHQMAYMDVPPVGPAKGTVVLMHGKNFNGAYWGKTASDLAKVGFRVIIPDQLGFGKSDKPIEYQYSFHALADNTRRLLESLKIKKVNVVGHSMGGMLAVRFALMFPQMVERLALVNPIGLEDWKRVVPYTPMDKRLVAEKKQSRESIIEYQKKSYYDGKWTDEYEKTAAPLIGWAQGPDKNQIAEIAAITTEMVFTQPVIYEFDLIKAPTLLIIGERDRTALGRNLVSAAVTAELGRYDRLGSQTCQKIPRCELVHLQGIGHLPQVEAYGDYIRALNSYLQRRYKKAPAKTGA